MTTLHSPARRRAAFTLIIAASLLGIAGTDLILPAIPALPGAFGATHERAQHVLAAFVAGTALGLLAFGALGARFDQRRLLVASLLSYAAISALAAFSPTLDAMIALRFVQGAAGSAAAVFAPGMIRKLYGEERAVAALGLFGSLEALAPAFAPILGLGLMYLGGWPASFMAIAVLAALLAFCVMASGDALPRPQTGQTDGSYIRLLSDPTYMRYALSHALTLGSLLIVIFSAPTVFVAALGAGISQFIAMQLVGIVTFMASANLASRASARWGAERLLWGGGALALASSAALWAYGLAGGGQTWVVTALFVPFNIGIGLRGPVGFHRAMVAAGGDDARGAAILVVAILGVAALATALVAPFILQGLAPIGLAAVIMAAMSLVLLGVLPKLEEAAA